VRQPKREHDADDADEETHSRQSLIECKRRDCGRRDDLAIDGTGLTVTMFVAVCHAGATAHRKVHGEVSVVVCQGCRARLWRRQRGI
jgi:hypothetical protein